MRNKNAFAGNTPINEKQKKFINGYTMGGEKRELERKQKTKSKKKTFYCPVWKDTYLATNSHIYCKLCSPSQPNPDNILHEVIEYNPKLHKL